MDSWYRIEVSSYLADKDRPYIVKSGRFLEVTEWCKDTNGAIYFDSKKQRWIFTTSCKEDIAAFKLRFEKTTNYYDKS